MAGLLKSLPPRSTKESDSKLINKAKTKKTATTVTGGGSSLIDRINIAVSLVQSKLGKYANDYIIIRDEKELEDYFVAMQEVGIGAIDTEASSLDPLNCNLAGICLYARGLKPAYVPFGHVSYITFMRTPDQLSQSVVATLLNKYHSSIKWVMHNAVYDVSLIKYRLGVDIVCYWDTWAAAKLLNEYESAALKDLHLKYCDPSAKESFKYNTLFDGIDFTTVPIKTAYLYAAGDGIKTMDLYDVQVQQLNRRNLPSIYRVFSEVEMPLIPVIAEIQHTGILFDNEYNDKLKVDYHKLLDEAAEVFYKATERYAKEIAAYRVKNPGNKLDDPILITSNQQLAILLYDIVGLKPVSKDKPRGTGDDILELLNTDITKAIQMHRTVSKLLSTYIDKLPNTVDANTSRIHATLNSLGARTGRFSSSDPNLQNIPSKDKRIRGVFIAQEDYDLISVDLSQQEPRTLADRSGDEALIEAYKQGKDIYAWVASIVYKVPYDECKEFRPDGSKNPEGAKRRTSMKSVILGIMYSRGAKAIAEQLGISVKEAQKIIDTFFMTFPLVKNYVENTIQFAHTNGYVETAWGRRCRIPDMLLDAYEFSYLEKGKENFDPLSFDSVQSEMVEVDRDIVAYYTAKLEKSYGKAATDNIKSLAASQGIKIKDNTMKLADATRQCVNSVIQGSAADMIKRGMILIHNDPKLKELGYRMLVPVHDEILGEAPSENCREAGERVAELMILAASEMVSVPMKCDIEISHRWYGESI